jgi:hemerythrin-like domain-containing protein
MTQHRRRREVAVGAKHCARDDARLASARAAAHNPSNVDCIGSIAVPVSHSFVASRNGYDLTMATTRTPRKRTTAQKTAARKARPVAKKARAVKKSAARKARPVAKKARAVKKTAARKARPVAKKARAVKKTAVKAAKKAPATKRPAASPRRGTRVDAIALLKQDHREVAQLFTRFERAGDGARQAKRRLVDAMIEALSRHAGIEELVFYPAVRREVKGADSDVLEAIEEHHVVKVLLHELEDLDPAHERFDAKVTVLIENVRHHVKEEEQELFPEVRTKLGRSRLLDIGDELQAAKRQAPTRPHPYAPDEPPANVIVGNAVAVIDRARTAGKKVVDRVRDEIPSL